MIATALPDGDWLIAAPRASRGPGAVPQERLAQRGLAGPSHRAVLLPMAAMAVMASANVNAVWQISHGGDPQALAGLVLVTTAVAATTGLVLLAISWRTQCRLLQRLGAVSATMMRMADREPAGFIPSLEADDAIGDMARALAVFHAEARATDAQVQ